MDGYLLLIGAIVIILGLFIWFVRKFGTPKATAQTLLGTYDAFEQSGLPEKDRLFKLLATRLGWMNLPHPFLRELTHRLGTKENVIGFVVLTERYGFDQKLPRLAAEENLEFAMRSIAIWLGSFGNKLQGEGQLGEAEFAQLLALRIQPNQSITILPLAVTYYMQGRYTEAVSLFEQGLPLFEDFAKSSKWMEQLSLPREFGSYDEMAELGVTYKKMYEDCLRKIDAQ